MALHGLDRSDIVENPKKANDRQVGGDHYKAPGLMEHWDYAWSKKFDQFQYSITKYVERWRKKDGLKDLLKAQHHLEKYIEVVKAELAAEAKSGLKFECHADDAGG